MRPAAALAAATACAVLLGLPACTRPPAPGDPLPGLSAAELDRFERGRAEFERVFTPATGLGPLFNADSCAACHEAPVAGGPGDEVEIHATAYDADRDSCDPLFEQGGPVIQQQATPALKSALGIDSEPVPPAATAQARRTTPDILGFGLLDAVPDSEILSRADPDDRDGDGISGRANRFFDGRLGRFGRKAIVPTLREFNEGAFVVEQGITTPAVPTEESIGGNPIPEGVDPVPEPEIDEEAVELTDAFVRFTAPPTPLKLTVEAKRGRELFSNIGCAKCHVPALKTGEHPVAALSRKEVAAYTDLLLHDMGPELADICLGLARPTEFRTEPLMGLRLSGRYLHDGRAGTLEEAIGHHGGEGARSRERFDALPEKDRQAVLEFLGSL